MARGRIISKSISTSRRINSVSDRAALVYTWTIPHLDEMSNMEGAIDILRAKVVPLRKYSDKQMLQVRYELASIGAWIVYKDAKGEEYIHVDKNDDHQIYKNDRKKIALVPEYKDELRIPLDSIGFQMDAIKESKSNQIKPKEIKSNLADESAPKVPSPHKQFIDWYVKTVFVARNLKINITGAAAKNLKEALKKQPFEELQKRAVYYLSHISFKEFSPGLETFLSAGVQNGIANKAKNGEEYWKDLERFSAKYITSNEDRLSKMKLDAGIKTIFA